MTVEAEAAAARDQYLQMLDRMAASGVEVNVSVKLTQMGLDISEDLCQANMVRILDKAKALGGFVRLDMEGSDYTQRTLDFFAHRLFPAYGAHCGVVIQSMLRRSEQRHRGLDAPWARGCVSARAPTWSPPTVAFPDKADVDRNYVRLMERLLVAATTPGWPRTTRRSSRSAAGVRHAPRASADERFEFQMLYGVRRDLQERLRRERATTCGSTSPSGPSGILTSCGGWRSDPPTSPLCSGNIVRESIPGR